MNPRTEGDCPSRSNLYFRRTPVASCIDEAGSPIPSGIGEEVTNSLRHLLKTTAQAQKSGHPGSGFPCPDLAFRYISDASDLDSEHDLRLNSGETTT